MAPSVTADGSSSGAGYTVPLFLNGQEVAAESQFGIPSPATGKTLYNCSNASSKDVTKAIDTAAEAFKTWRKTTPSRRRDIFLKAAEIMESRREELVKTMNEETGATDPWSNLNVTNAIEIMKDVAGRISGIEGMLPATADPSVGAMVFKEPFGVVLAISPW